MATLTPEIFKKIRQIEFFTNKLVDDLFSGAYRSAFRGNGIEFEEVREYEIGDDDRLIDWNVSARTNHLHVKTFREERNLTILLIIDTSYSLHFGTKREKGSLQVK